MYLQSTTRNTPLSSSARELDRLLLTELVQIASAVLTILMFASWAGRKSARDRRDRLWGAL